MIERFLGRLAGIFLAGGILFALLWPIILVVIIVHFLIKWW